MAETPPPLPVPDQSNRPNHSVGTGTSAGTSFMSSLLSMSMSMSRSRSSQSNSSGTGNGDNPESPRPASPSMLRGRGRAIRSPRSGGEPGAGLQQSFVPESPLRRAGLLQTMSHPHPSLPHHLSNTSTSQTHSTFTSNANSGNPFNAQIPNHEHERPAHEQEDIRKYTLELSSLPMSPEMGMVSSSLVSGTPVSFGGFGGRVESIRESDEDEIEFAQGSEGFLTDADLLDVTPSPPYLPSPGAEAPTPRAPRSLSPQQPSALSVLLEQHPHPRTRLPGGDEDESPTTPRAVGARPAFAAVSSMANADGLPPPISAAVAQANETTPLLPSNSAHTCLDRSADLESASASPSPARNFTRKVQKNVKSFAKTRLSPHGIKTFGITSVRSLPAVLLGTLLNILDALSYGMLIFPASSIFAELPTASMGVSMFFISALISQLVYTFGGSGFKGANGSMMIEVVPFFHILATSIAGLVPASSATYAEEVMSTTIFAFALSSVLTGATFLLLGALNLGVLIQFFPRHILVGCIGGVGAFLLETGFTVCMRIDEDELTLPLMFDPGMMIMWAPPLGLAVLLRLITWKWKGQLVFPIYFLVIPIIFYVVVFAGRMDLQTLREQGWLFDVGGGGSGGGDTAWYAFYGYFSFSKIRWGAIAATLTTQFALLFFNILHPPLNVPALSVSLDEDCDTNHELLAHGYSNLLSGLVLSVPNYLVYVNTLLFYRVGGGTRVAGGWLAVMTAVLLAVGTEPIGFIPVCVVGALIFVLGIDLVKEAVWDTRGRASLSEYVTILAIIVTMTLWDFVIGVLLGIIISSIFFVIQASRHNSIRSITSGSAALSSVRRPSAHRAYLREACKQTTILRLQGFLFFGTIARVEEAIRGVMHVEGEGWRVNPVRFLVLDMSMVPGVDMSAAEAFVRVYRILEARRVTLVFCGFGRESPVGEALRNVGIFGERGVELFGTLGDAMEWTENGYLRAWFGGHKEGLVGPVDVVNGGGVQLPGRQDVESPFYVHSPAIASSPRRSHLREVGHRAFTLEHSPPRAQATATAEDSEPYETLAKAFSAYGPLSPSLFNPLPQYLQKIHAPAGLVLWNKNDPPDGLYLIQSGVLRASYEFVEHAPCVEESMVGGTIAGELSALSGLPRNARVVVEREAVLWKLSMENLAKLEVERPELSRAFTALVLKAAKYDYDVLLAALANRQ